MFVKDKIDPKTIKKERLKAKALRSSQWWKQILGKGLCACCGETFSPEDLTMDHKIPVSRGGRSTKGNVQPCCKPCNSRKKDFTPVEMILDGLK